VAPGHDTATLKAFPADVLNPQFAVARCTAWSEPRIEKDIENPWFWSGIGSEVLVTGTAGRGVPSEPKPRRLAEIGGNPASAANRCATPYPCG
jgi:hypothetical protein